MKLFQILLFIINTVYAIDYFDILKKELYNDSVEKVRNFYITAEEVIWDYASQSDSKPSAHMLGTKYYKALYYEYTDITFTKKKEKYKWQGNMGPILKAEVGETIVVHFWNKATQPLTIHPHKVLPRAGPGPADGNSVVWGYHSHLSEADIYMGLYGAILIYRPGTISNDEIVTSFFVSDEDESPYIKKTISDLYLKQDTHRKSNSFDVINGLIHSSPSDLVFKKKKVVWHLIGWGTHWDIHYVKWEHGKAVLNDKQVDQVRLFPASFYTVNLQFNESGQWKFGYLDQKSEGMTMYYNVSL
ncbi:hypothetical protein G6F65_001503 [Rhizopus arrhizus]|nr:hypothetical protein G6F65_001503 [Rhizopus arrhizus]